VYQRNPECYRFITLLCKLWCDTLSYT